VTRGRQWAVTTCWVLLASSGSLAQTPTFAAPEASPLTASDTDLMPRDEADRREILNRAAFDATVYGYSAVLQYQQLYRQAVNRASPAFTGFNRFAHERTLAGPDYPGFKVPNSDTLYSTAWIDLTRGPVTVTVPPTRLKYYTLNIFDIYGNPSNIGTRTVGSAGGRYLLVPPGWTGQAPAGTRIYRAATPHLWVLMRVFAQTKAEVADARRFQDGVIVTSPDRAGGGQAPVPPAPGGGAAGFLRVLDYILRVDGALPGEEAHVRQFLPLGIDGKRPFDAAALDPQARAAIESGHAAALAVIDRAKSQLGSKVATGWMRVNKGRYGSNYLRRATVNAAGLGANAPEENASFTAFLDVDGAKLDGSTGSYVLHLTTPPPVDAFWSLTLYDAKTFALSPNPLGRYLVNDRSPGLVVGKDGSVTIRIQHNPLPGANWLPAPDGPFFVVLRSYLPRPPLLDGSWLPGPIRRAAEAGK
jgi:hypothetical protein